MTSHNIQAKNPESRKKPGLSYERADWGPHWIHSGLLPGGPSFVQNLGVILPTHRETNGDQSGSVSLNPISWP